MSTMPIQTVDDVVAPPRTVRLPFDPVLMLSAIVVYETCTSTCEYRGR